MCAIDGCKKEDLYATSKKNSTRSAIIIAAAHSRLSFSPLWQRDEDEQKFALFTVEGRLVLDATSPIPAHAEEEQSVSAFLLFAACSLCVKILQGRLAFYASN